jgi:UDP-N-acetylmuramate: L-alanyl-gamma-D-glutamyl-meso-diaminopimelate ligase
MNIHVVGIAGAGVSALVSVLVSEGHSVTGSDDAAYPPVTTYLDRLGVTYGREFDAANVPAHVDLAIVGTTAKIDPRQNPETAELERRGVPRFTFAAYLGSRMGERESTVIAGSFGKSTLTAMIAHTLRAAGRDPGYFIGAVSTDLPTTGHWGSAPEFILEGDEYVISPTDRRPKFELYQPRNALISSIVHDHVNMFPTMAEYEATFAKLVALVPPEGLLVGCARYAPIRRLTAGRDVVWYGLDQGIFRAQNIRVGETTRFEIVTPDHGVIPMATKQLGLHNVENHVGAAALILSRGWTSPEAVAAAAGTFQGVTRRLDRKTKTSRIPAYEGFGSSYEKARSAIEAMQLHFPGRRIVVVFEPHTFSWRNAEALAWYDSVFEGVGEVLLLPPPTHGAQAHAQLSQHDIADRIAAAGIPVRSVADAEETLAALAQLTGEEALLLLSSGPLAGLAETAPRLLDERFS